MKKLPPPSIFIVLLCYCVTVLLLPPAAFAFDTSQPGCAQIGPSGDVPSLACLAQVVVSVINIAFLFLGFVALVFLLWGAIKFVISRGDPKALQSARNTMTYAVIGTVLIIMSFALVTIITNALGLPNPLQNFSFYQP